MSAEARKLASATIADIIDAQVLTGLVPGSVVAIYAAKGTEVDTTAIAAHALDRGLAVAYPRVAKPSPVLAYHRVDFAALVPGVFGLLEPRADAPAVTLADLSAIIVPGIAFDATGHRLGWGRGYYDNTLAAARSVTSIGVAFACQLLPAVPTTPTDVPVHFVITEAGAVRTLTMSPPVIAAIAAVAGIVIGALVGRMLAAKPTGPASSEEAERLRTAALAEAEQIKKSAEVEGKEAAQKMRSGLDDELRAKRTEVTRREEAIAAKEREIDKLKRDAERRASEIDKKEKSAEGRAKQAEAAVEKAEAAQAEAKQKLEAVARLSEAEARKQLEDAVRVQAQAAVAAEMKKIEDDAEAEAQGRAKTIIAAAIQRYASEFVHERTVAVIPLPSDDLKGRLIGREGRNVRALEAATGIDLIIDDTAESITISCFNPVRREIARIAISALVADGRIHPTRIEEVVRKAEKEVDKVCKEAGEAAVFDLGLNRVHPELVKLVGRLKYRQSYAQNLLAHSVEVGYLAGLMAAELGQNVKLARRAGLLHDVGKAIDHEQEGNHAEVSAQVARRHGESPKVCQAIAAHHGDVPAVTVLDHIVHAANALSAARPGARREQLASYIKRLDDLEAICRRFGGVEKAFALQAGREVRVMVLNDQVDDAQAMMLSKEIARTIESEASYPGQVRVVVVRETRASDYAR